MNYFKDDEAMSWVAAHAFTDVHHGGPMTELEYEMRSKIFEEYKGEIELAKLMLENNPDFQKLSYENQINFAAKLIIDLKKRKENIVEKRGKNL